MTIVQPHHVAAFRFGSHGADTTGSTRQRPGPGSGAEPVRSFDFAKYHSNEEFQADIYSETSNPDGFGYAKPPYNRGWIELQGPSSGFGGVGQAVRYTWKKQGTCTSTAIQYDMALPHPHQREVWLEYYERFSSNPRFETFVGDRPPGPGCRSNNGYKYLHFYSANGSRFPLDIGIFRDHSSQVYLPPKGKLAFSGRGRRGAQWSDLTDGKWHKIRAHWRLPSGANTADGYFQFSVDGVALANPAGHGGWDTGTHERPFRSIAFGRNNNQGPNSAHVGMWREFSNVRVYYTNPGWTVR